MKNTERQRREVAWAIKKNKGPETVDHAGKRWTSQRRKGDKLIFAYTDGTVRSFYVPLPYESGTKSIERCRSGSYGD